MTNSGNGLEQLPTSAIVAEALLHAALLDDTDDECSVHCYWDCVGELHKRGGQTEFNAARALLAGNTPVERSLAASILGQLGYGNTFIDESVTLLIQALSDPDATVICAAAHGLGHRHSVRAIESLLAHVANSSAEIRDAITHGLGCLDDRRATDGLIQLSRDPDDLVRDYASFNLGEMCIIDYPELRAALHALLADPAAEIRGQALIGLARRGDRTSLPAIRSELSGDYHGAWAVKAAGYLADSTLASDLETLLQRELADLPSWHLNDFRDAMEACRSGTPVPAVN
jgi:HEAT repeat protein